MRYIIITVGSLWGRAYLLKVHSCGNVWTDIIYSGEINNTPAGMHWFIFLMCKYEFSHIIIRMILIVFSDTRYSFLYNNISVICDSFCKRLLSYTLIARFVGPTRGPSWADRNCHMARFTYISAYHISTFINLTIECGPECAPIFILV